MTLFGMEVVFVMSSLCGVSCCSLSLGVDLLRFDSLDSKLLCEVHFKCGRNEADDCVEEEKEDEEEISSPFVSSIFTECDLIDELQLATENMMIDSTVFCYRFEECKYDATVKERRLLCSVAS